MTSVYINGRFFAQPATGVQRYAKEIVRAIDKLLAKNPRTQQFSLLLPPDAPEIPDYEQIEIKRVGRSHGVSWEQFALPNAARDGLLLCLGGIGSLLHPHQIVTYHDAGIYRNSGNFSIGFRLWYRAAMPFIGRRAYKVLTVSDFSKRELSECAGIPENRLVVTGNAAEHIGRNPASPDILAKNGLAPESYLLFVGGDILNKNIRVVLRALSINGESSLPLVCVGEADAKVFSKRPGRLRPNIHTLGRASDGELRALYENAYCLVFPSLYEGFGIPPIEAMQCECPVISSNTSALPGTCGDAALYFDPNDAEELAQQLNRLQQDTELRQILIKAGLQRASQFSWEKCATLVLEQLN